MSGNAVSWLHLGIKSTWLKLGIKTIPWFILKSPLYTIITHKKASFSFKKTTKKSQISWFFCLFWDRFINFQLLCENHLMFKILFMQKSWKCMRVYWQALENITNAWIPQPNNAQGPSRSLPCVITQYVLLKKMCQIQHLYQNLMQYSDICWNYVLALQRQWKRTRRQKIISRFDYL